MQHSLYIKKIAVLGSGVMGAQIAAHCVNAGFETYLFDLADAGKDKLNKVNQGIAKLKQLKPSPLGYGHISTLIHACEYEDHLPLLRECDLVIEAIAERRDWKESLYRLISPYLNPHAILASNTSGLSIHDLAKVLPEETQKRFLGMHFFNPPRYMHLVELIATEMTDSALCDHMESWLTQYLGKGVVRAKDTPNFIANRIGVFALLTSLHWADVFKLGLDTVDALTGALIGRPKSATCRTMDVVGLDTMQHVVETMQQHLSHDPWHAYFALPSWLCSLIEQGHLGQKSGQGIYRKAAQGIEVYDTSINAYRSINGGVSEEVQAIMAEKNTQVRMTRLFSSHDVQARFLAACLLDLLHYSAYHAKAIAHTVRDIDQAMCWGFGWQKGPFDEWQQAGIGAMKTHIERAMNQKQSMSDVPLPSWLETVDMFYDHDKAYSPDHEQWIADSALLVYRRQLIKENQHPVMTQTHPVLFENDAVCLWEVEPHIGVITFKTKANSIGLSLIDGLNQSLDLASERLSGVIIFQRDPMNFSAGANLREVNALVESKRFSDVDALLSAFQSVLLRIKYSVIPVVAALRGKALGGGCELMMHCHRTVAAFESYPGLVEVGVGLIPAGGGCKEMALRASSWAVSSDVMPKISSYFMQTANAYVAESAIDAQYHGLLQATDTWVMHTNEVLYVAIAEIKAMQAANYLPPLPEKITTAGKEGYSQLLSVLINYLEGGFMSQHDYFICSQLAYVLCGGDIYQGTLVDEAWLLKLEREMFMSLLRTDLTQARIKHWLQNGKPLRN